MKLDLARARAKEEAEEAWLACERKQRMELRRLEEEASLAELEWKIEPEYNDEGSQAPGPASPLDAATFLVDKRPRSTQVTSEKIETSSSNATCTFGKETVSQLNPCREEPITPVSSILKSRDNTATQTKWSFSATESYVRKTLGSVKSPPSFIVLGVQHSQKANCGDHAHVILLQQWGRHKCWVEYNRQGLVEVQWIFPSFVTKFVGTYKMICLLTPSILNISLSLLLEKHWKW